MLAGVTVTKTCQAAAAEMMKARKTDGRDQVNLPVRFAAIAGPGVELHFPHDLCKEPVNFRIKTRIRLRAKFAGSRPSKWRSLVSGYVTVRVVERLREWLRHPEGEWSPAFEPWGSPPVETFVMVGHDG